MTPAPLEAARADLDVALPDLWLAYFALGGTKTTHQLGVYLAEGDREGGPATTDADHDALVHALNELYAERGRAQAVPYRTP